MVPLCPACDEPLLIVEFEGVEADFCPQCQGVWLDEGELEVLAQADPGDPLLQFRPGVSQPATFPRMEVEPRSAGGQSREPQEPARSSREHRRRCPRCDQRMRELVVGREPQILMDVCPQQHGLWFDRGELRQLLKQFGPSAGRSVAILNELFAATVREETPKGPG